MKVLPTHDRVLIELIEDAETTPGGIMIPDEVKEKPSRGLVIRIGPGRILQNGDFAAMSVSAGHTVLFGKYASTKVKGMGKNLVLVKDEDILAVLVEEKENG